MVATLRHYSKKVSDFAARVRTAENVCMDCLRPRTIEGDKRMPVDPAIKHGCTQIRDHRAHTINVYSKMMKLEFRKLMMTHVLKKLRNASGEVENTRGDA